jgi:hypothetical protein
MTLFKRSSTARNSRFLDVVNCESRGTRSTPSPEVADTSKQEALTLDIVDVKVSGECKRRYRINCMYSNRLSERRTHASAKFAGSWFAEAQVGYLLE